MENLKRVHSTLEFNIIGSGTSIQYFPSFSRVLYFISNYLTDYYFNQEYIRMKGKRDIGTNICKLTFHLIHYSFRRLEHSLSSIVFKSLSF